MTFGSFTYSAEIAKSVRFGIIIGVVAGFLFALTRSTATAIIMGGFIFLVYVAKAMRWNKHYITSLEVKGDKLILQYLDKGEAKQVEVSLSSVNAKKSNAFSQARIPYMRITSAAAGLSIRQYEVGEWTEEKMDATLKLLSRE